MPDQSCDPLEYLRTRVLPYYTDVSDAEPAGRELIQLKSFGRRLTAEYQRAIDGEIRLVTFIAPWMTLPEVRSMFGQFAPLLRKIKHHRLRAAYWEQIVERRADFDAEVDNAKREAAERQQKLADSKRQQRQPEIDRYTANPAEFIGVLAREYQWLGSDIRKSDRLYARADNFVVGGYYWCALKQCGKSGDRKRAMKIIADVQRAILKELPSSAFRRHLQQKVKSVGLRWNDLEYKPPTRRS